MHNTKSTARFVAPTFTSLLIGSGKSMSQVAKESGISISMVSRVASGSRTPSLTMVFRLAGTLGVDVAVMLEAFNPQSQVDAQSQVHEMAEAA